MILLLQIPKRRAAGYGVHISQSILSLGCRRTCTGLTRAAPSGGGGRPFADFLEFQPPEAPDASTKGPATTSANPDKKAQELIDRTAALLGAAQEALRTVRSRDPSDSRHRRSGPDITAGPTVTTTSSDSSSSKTNVETKPSGGGVHRSPAAIGRAPTLSWDTDDDGEDEDDGILSNTSRSGGSAWSPGSNEGSSGGAGGGGPSNQFGAPGSLDSWFGGKVDAGPMSLRPAALKPTAAGVVVLDRPDMPSSLEFAPPKAPEESGASTVFPESLALRFQSEIISPDSTTAAMEQEIQQQQFVSATATADAPAGDWERHSGEEFGEDGYWYRWTEVRGRDATGAVQWFERWWEASDWKGMKELGAEKWGCNTNGDAWRETWRESIGFDEVTRQPTVERSAHKWAKSAVGAGQEWEEKWSESYWSGGKADKWADKWGRDGAECWHEKWGESYDGQGGCVKWTDRWAERPPLGGGLGLDKWGDKWEETFKDGQGGKRGETWNESSHGDKYQRWWGENHFGQGLVQKFGSSTTGEHWDTTEQQDTYYNPIPHFGYDLALSHSPQLRTVPVLPRDGDLGASTGSGGAAGGNGGLGALFADD